MTIILARVHILGNLNKTINKVEKINFNNDVYKAEQLI